MAEGHVRGVPVKFKMDTGADVSVISEKDFLKVGKYPFQESDRKLCDPGKNELWVKEHLSTTMSQMGKSSKQDILTLLRGFSRPYWGALPYRLSEFHIRLITQPALRITINSFPDCFSGALKPKSLNHSVSRCIIIRTRGGYRAETN